MNLYYREGPPHPTTGSQPYVSPDAMVVQAVPGRWTNRSPPTPSAKTARPHCSTAEVLSERSAQQRDLRKRCVVYARLGVPEYILVDVTRQVLPERLLLKRLQKDGTYQDERDPDGGVTSKLGFRVVIEPDGLRRHRQRHGPAGTLGLMEAEAKP